MPQLDKFAYFEQVLWLMTSLVLIYSFFITYALPRVARVLKYRQKVLGNDVPAQCLARAKKSISTYRKTLKDTVNLSINLNRSIQEEQSNLFKLNYYLLNNYSNSIFKSTNDGIRKAIMDARLRKIVIREKLI